MVNTGDLVVGGWKRSFAPSNPTTKIPSISCVHKVAVGEVVAWLGCEEGAKLRFLTPPSNQFSDSYLVST
tara:strand:- start:371 stop:580 length:210 start_codon:yes stop_codon:yes gene_type:complete